MSLLKLIGVTAGPLGKTSGTRIGRARQDPALDAALPRAKAGRPHHGLERAGRR